MKGDLARTARDASIGTDATVIDAMAIAVASEAALEAIEAIEAKEAKEAREAIEAVLMTAR